MARTVPVMAQESPGNFNTGALWNANTKALGDFILGRDGATGPPRFRGYQATVQSLTTGVWTSLTLDTETIDSDGGHSTVTNTSRYVCQVAGTYLITGSIAFAPNATGNRGSRLALNGVEIRGSGAMLPTASGNTHGQVVSHLIPLAVNDYVEVQAYQNSTISLNTASSTDLAPSMCVLFVSF